MARAMKIAVLDLTTHPEPLLTGRPRAAAQLIDWIGQGLPEADFAVYDIAEQHDPMPQVSDFDGLLLSGSEVGVYDPLPWMEPLRQLLRDTKAAGKPIYGVCFGHQIMADTFGGKAEKASVGLHVGARAFEFSDGVRDTHVWHKDQVTAVPPGAIVTAKADYCPVGALEYDFPAASVQFHPEFSEHEMRTLHGLFLGKGMTKEEVASAAASFENAKVAVDEQAHEAGAFFRRHISG